MAKNKKQEQVFSHPDFEVVLLPKGTKDNPQKTSWDAENKILSLSNSAQAGILRAAKKLPMESLLEVEVDGCIEREERAQAYHQRRDNMEATRYVTKEGVVTDLIRVTGTGFRSASLFSPDGLDRLKSEGIKAMEAVAADIRKNPAK